MKLNQLRWIRLGSFILAILLLCAGGITAVSGNRQGKDDADPSEVSATADPSSSTDQDEGSEDEKGEDGQPAAESSMIPSAKSEEENNESEAASAELAEESDESAASSPTADSESNGTESNQKDNGKDQENQAAGQDEENPSEEKTELDQTDQYNNNALTGNNMNTVPDNQDYETSQGKFTLPTLSVVFLALGVLSAAAAVVSHLKMKQMEKEEMESHSTVIIPSSADEKTLRVSVPQLTHAEFNRIGKRPRQEDCCGVLPTANGMLAILADGMGGLKNGGAISELVVRTMMEQGQRRSGAAENNVLLPMLSAANEAVNRYLGANIYKSGSTMLAVWIQDKGRQFQWVTVGDSRIYLYRGGSLIQLNQEHNLGQELLGQAISGKITFEEARNNPKKSALTSFIGMGQLKYVDHSVRPIDLQPGDRILLMSDGVFNAVTDQQITQVLARNADVQAAANSLVSLVEQFGNPRQDNYTAIILGI